MDPDNFVAEKNRMNPENLVAEKDRVDPDNLVAEKHRRSKVNRQELVGFQIA